LNQVTVELKEIKHKYLKKIDVERDAVYLLVEYGFASAKQV